MDDNYLFQVWFSWRDRHFHDWAYEKYLDFYTVQMYILESLALGQEPLRFSVDD
jgi:hypothetical protein